MQVASYPLWLETCREASQARPHPMRPANGYDFGCDEYAYEAAEGLAAPLRTANRRACLAHRPWKQARPNPLAAIKHDRRLSILSTDSDKDLPPGNKIPGLRVFFAPATSGEWVRCATRGMHHGGMEKSGTCLMRSEQSRRVP
jgi:hypothetical protein